jgi:hypothetical protein
MKTSHMMFSVIAIAVMLALITGLLFVRKDLNQFIQQSEKERYSLVQLDTFQHIKISSGWNVRIRQGKQFRVLLNVADTVFRPSIRSANGLLELVIDTMYWNSEQPVHAKITLPILYSIRAEGNTSIDIEDFKADSLTVTLLNGCRFKGQKNAFRRIVFNSDADVRIELMDEYSDL